MAASTKKQSSGILLFRIRNQKTEVLLAHPGGPFFKNKDLGAWSIPKGELETGEAPVDAARREFQEETGFEPSGELVPLGQVRQKSGKVVHGFCVQGDFDPTDLPSNTFDLEWPPRSGKTQSFPEIDRAEFFDLETAREKINGAQAAFLDRLLEVMEK